MNTIRLALYVGCLGILVACGGGDDPSVRQSFAWVAPVEYEDGSPLTDLAGYRMYRNGEMILDVIDPSLAGAEIDGESGDIVWLTAYNSDGVESDSSNAVTIP